MYKSKKIIIFIIIMFISISSLILKGYFTDEKYVLNGESDLSSSEEIIKTNEINDEEDENISKNIDEDIKDEKSINGGSEIKNIIPKEITVYISGEVKNQGVVTLQSDKRLADAVEKLGGVTKKADMNNINLAMKLEDEMHYIIPKKGEKNQNIIAQNKDNFNSNNGTNNSNENNKSSQISGNENQSNKININTADIQELDKLPGVGEATANKIVNYREDEGNFKSIEEIKNVNGIGDKKYENMKDLICVK